MSDAAYRSQYNYTYQQTPIVFHGGIANKSNDGLLPINQLIDINATYMPMPSSTVINNSVGMYPFANTQVAANAIIEQPLSISLLMIIPVSEANGYSTKLSKFTSLQTLTKNHIESGGTFHVVTPSYIYADCLLLQISDVTTGEGHQQQIFWRWDFIKPLVTENDAELATNSLMSKLQSGQQVDNPAWSGSGASNGTAPQNASTGIRGIAGQLNSFPALGN